MNALKKILGIVWLVLAPVLIVMMFNQLFTEIPALEKAIAAGKKPASELQSTYLFWVITITIFVPIAFGLALFGYYSLKGEYDRTVMSSADL
jgi:glucan phosphoethanolaminetransferase (alkaline phosphatase superfamily)